MTIRTFWHLIIKTIGIWIFIQGLISFPGLAMKLILASGGFYGSPAEFFLTEGFVLVVLITSYILVLRYLVLKTQRVIDLLKLEKGMEETRIDFTLPYKKVLRIIILLIGGIVFILAIPNLIENLYSFITEDRPFKESPRATSLIIGVVQAIIGFLVMTNSDIVQRYIDKRSHEAETKQLDKEEF